MDNANHVFRVSDEKSIFHMTKNEIETSEMKNIRVLSLLGYCKKCGNYSTESDLEDFKNYLVCVVCGFKRKYI